MSPLTIGLVLPLTGREVDPAAAVRHAIAATGVSYVQAGIGALAEMPAELQKRAIDNLRQLGPVVALAYAGFAGEDYSSRRTIALSGGFVPEPTFKPRLETMRRCAAIAAELQIPFISAHAGFIPDPSQELAFEAALERVRQVTDAAAACNVTLGLETGQEPAPVLLEFLRRLDRKNVAVNFDPANMILYGSGDPTAAAQLLLPWIYHVHAKDARAAPAAPADAWAGQEVPLGEGEARLPEVLQALQTGGYAGKIAIERESDNAHLNDIAAGVKYLKSLS